MNPIAAIADYTEAIDQHIQYIHLIPAYVIALWAIGILTKKPPQLRSQRLAAYGMILVGALLFCFSLYFNSNYNQSLWVDALYTLILSSLAPTYYLHIRQLTGITGISLKDFWMHIFIILVLICYVVLYIGLDPSEVENYMLYARGIEKTPAPTSMMKFAYFIDFLSYIIWFQIVATIVWGIRRKIRFYKVLREFHANTEGKHMYFPAKSIAFECLELPLLTFYTIMPMEVYSSFTMSYIITIIQIMLFSILGSYVLHIKYSAADLRAYILSKTNNNVTELHEIVDELYATSRQNVMEMSKMAAKTKQLQSADNSVDKTTDQKKTVDLLLPKKLLDRIEEEQMYLEPDLNLLSLANKLQVERLQLSHSIHYHYYTNLSGLMVKLRIKHAQQLMRDPATKKEPVQYFAHHSGYTGVNNFIRDFETITQLTPRQYLDNLV